MRISIRQRLTFWYAATLVAGLCAFGLVMWLALQQRLVAGVDARLAERCPAGLVRSWAHNSAATRPTPKKLPAAHCESAPCV
jgi:hypothetical protein